MGQYNANWNSGSVPDGSYTITFYAKDGAGLVSQTTETIVVSNGVIGGGNPPTVAVTNPTPSPQETFGLQVAPPNNSSVIGFAGTATDPYGIRSAGFRIDGSSTLLSATNQGGGYPSPGLFPSPSLYPGSGTGNTWTLSYETNGILADGQHSVVFEAINNNGVSAATPQVFFVIDNVAGSIDTTPPTGVLITSPAANACVGAHCSTPASSVLTLTAVATDAESGIAKVDFWIDLFTAGQIKLPGGVPVVTGTPGQSSSTITYQTAAPNYLLEGAHTLVAVATNGIGLTAGSPVVNFTVTNCTPGTDCTPPTLVAVTNPTSGQQLATGQVLTFTGTATDNESAVTAGQFILDGQTSYHGLPLTAVLTNPSAHTWAGTFTLSDVLAVGNHTLAFSATSQGGTTTSPLISFNVATINPPPPPPQVRTPTQRQESLDDILHARVRRIAASVVFELVDDAGSMLGQLHPVADAGQIRWRSTNTIRRTITGIELPPDEVADINVFTDRVQVFWRFGDIKVPVGRFEFGDVPVRVASPDVRFAQPMMNDLGARLSYPIWRTVSYPAGTNVAQAIRSIFGELGYLHAAVDDLGVVTSGPVGFQLGQKTWLAVLEALAALNGCYPPYADSLGTPTVRAVPTISDENATFSYTPGPECVILSSTDPQEKTDTSAAVNLFIVTENGANQAPIYGSYELPPDAPQSFANRGYYVPKIITAQGVGSSANATTQAIAAATTAQYHRTITFSTIPNPLHDGFELVRMYDGLVYLETDWDLNLKPEGPHTHTVQRAVNVTATITGVVPTVGGGGGGPPPPPGQAMTYDSSGPTGTWDNGNIWG